MDIPLTPIVPAGEPMDGGVGTSVLGTSSGGRVGEALPRVGEAPLPPMGFAQVKDFNQAQVVEWLDSIGYFKLFSSGLELATSKEDFLAMDLVGEVLLESGHDIDMLLRKLSLGKANKLRTIIKRVYLDAGIFSLSFTNSTRLTIT